MNKNCRGFTLVELLIGVTIVGIIMFALIRFLPQIPTFVRHTQLQQQMQSEGRICMDSITRFLRLGKASSVLITTPTTGPFIPNSRIDFLVADPLPGGTTAYLIYVDNGKAFLESFPGNGLTTLGAHVSGLIFTGDFLDLSIVNVSLRMDAYADTAQTQPITLILPTQPIRMVMKQ